MRRFAALLLSLALLLSVSSASAATLMEKFTGQFTEQGFKSTITLTASGDTTAAVSADTWAWLTSAAPRTTVELTHSFADKSDGQAVINLLIDGQPAGKTSLLYNAKLMGLSSDLLTVYGATWYTAARDWDLSSLFQGLIQQGGAWPPVWRLLAAVEGAPDAWKEEAAQHLVSFQTKLGTWLNGYAAASTVSDRNGSYTQLRWVIPAKDLKAETKLMLSDFYANSALLALLGKIFTPQEAACYLQPGMRPILEAWVDRTELAGEVEITRRYNSAGQAVLDQIKLPFAKQQLLTDLTVTLTPDKAGQNWRFQGTTRNGAAFDITCLAAGDQIYSGGVEMVLPASDGGQEKTVAFDYNFTWDGGKEEYSLSTDRFEQTMAGTLVIKPRDGKQPSQSLSLKAAFSSASSARSSTRLEAELTWRDLDGGAAVTAALSGRTAAPTAVEKLADQKKTVRLDRLADGGFEPLIQQWKQRFGVWLQETAEQLLPAALPEN